MKRKFVYFNFSTEVSRGGHSSETRSHYDSGGYLLVNMDGTLARETLFLVWERAKEEVGANQRIVARAWWERRHGVIIREKRGGQS